VNIFFFKKRCSLSYPWSVITYEGLHICVLLLNSFSPTPIRSFMLLRKKCTGSAHPLPDTSNGPVEVFQTFTTRACSLTKERMRMTHNHWSRITEQWTINTLWQHGGPNYISLSQIEIWSGRNSNHMQSWHCSFKAPYRRRTGKLHNPSTIWRTRCYLHKHWAGRVRRP